MKKRVRQVSRAPIIEFFSTEDFAYVEIDDAVA